MSLMRLLAAGSSLRGIRDRPSPYKMTQQHLLPKFGSAGKGPETKPYIPGRAGLDSGWHLGAPPESQPQPTATAARIERNEVSQPEEPKPAAPGKPRAGGFFARLLGFRSPFRPQVAAAKITGPVQGELRLERVTVVRNDLSDSDLELMAVSRGTDRTVPVKTTAASSEPSRASWQRVAARLFGDGRT